MSQRETSLAKQPYPRLSKFLAPPGSWDDSLLRERVEGKTILITGASRGIGRALAICLAGVGARLLLASRDESELKKLADEISILGGNAFCYQLDLRDPEQIDELVARVVGEHDGVDVVVHNAGKSIRRSIYQSIERMHDFERTIKVNYLGPVQLQLGLLPAMIARGQGQIVNVSTIGVRLSPAVLWAAYTASKAAFDAWIGSVAPELKASGISCSRVYLGLVHTAMSAPTKSYASLPGQTSEQAARVLCRALIERPRTLQPWWLGPVRTLVGPFESLFDYWQYRWGPVKANLPRT